MALLLTDSNCKRRDRSAESQGGKNKIIQTSGQVTVNEKESRIIEELQSKISKLDEKRIETERLLAYYISTVSEVCEGLNDINIGYIEIYSGELKALERRSLKHRLLKKIEQVKQIIDDNRRLVKELKISKEEVNDFENLVMELKKQLEIQTKEISELREDYFVMREKNLDLRETNFNLKKEISNLESIKLSLKKEQEQVKREYELEKEKHNIKNVLLVTPKSLIYYECTSQAIKISGKDIRILSSHLTGSYNLKKINNNNCILEIFDWENFWMSSKFLVIFYK